jgi:hypothetical protein
MGAMKQPSTSSTGSRRLTSLPTMLLAVHSSLTVTTLVVVRKTTEDGPTKTD